MWQKRELKLVYLLYKIVLYKAQSHYKVKLSTHGQIWHSLAFVMVNKLS